MGGALACLAGCWTSPPTADEVRAIGFRTPEQAFRTFQTAVRLEPPDPGLELRCFSAGFRERNGASQLMWREVREQLFDRNPWLRAGIAGARIGRSEPAQGGWFLSVEAKGQRGAVFLVREDFAEVWAGGERVVDDPVDWPRATGVQDAGSGDRSLYGRATLGANIDPAAVTELRLGREWKIDDFALLEDDPPHRVPTADAPRN